jgi:hypothetical protein
MGYRKSQVLTSWEGNAWVTRVDGDEVARAATEKEGRENHVRAMKGAEDWGPGGHAS